MKANYGQNTMGKSKMAIERETGTKFLKLKSDGYSLREHNIVVLLYEICSKQEKLIVVENGEL